MHNSECIHQKTFIITHKMQLPRTIFWHTINVRFHTVTYIGKKFLWSNAKNMQEVSHFLSHHQDISRKNNGLQQQTNNWRMSSACKI